jgi:hypothetical protein
MEAISSVSAAFGVVGFDALNDLANWLDGRIEPARTAGWRNRTGDRAAPAERRSAGREA